MENVKKRPQGKFGAFLEKRLRLDRVWPLLTEEGSVREFQLSTVIDVCDDDLEIVSNLDVLFLHVRSEVLDTMEVNF